MNQQIEEVEETVEQQLHWLHGLEEYIQHIKHPQQEMFADIKRALLQGNPWKIEKLIRFEIDRGPIQLTDEFIKLIMSHHTEYKEVNSRKVLRYIAHSIDDDYIRKISSWSIKWQNKANLIDHFSRGQMSSKLWMIDELQKIYPDKHLGTIAHYGGWYATIAQLIFKHFKVKQYMNLEADFGCLEIADDFNYEQQVDNWRFKSVGLDVNNVYWQENSYFKVTPINKAGEKTTLRLYPDLIINTSCEHMSENWFEKIPEGIMVCLQTNDYFSNEQHHNCVHGINEAMAKYPMKELWYHGELETAMYKRFMLIGKK